MLLYVDGRMQGCELINQQAAEGERLENFDAVLDMMDMDNNESIDINEFFEVNEPNRHL